MEKSILMSIKPEWAEKILNGEKTIELRKRFPKDYKGWVYIYCTKAKPYLTKIYGECCLTKYTCIKSLSGNVELLNGKVVARFWCDTVGEITIMEDGTKDNDYIVPFWFFGKNTCMSLEETNKYRSQSHSLFAIRISKLEIFNKPKELYQFTSCKKRLIDCGMGCPPYYDEVLTPLRRAPQSWQYIYVKE